MFRKNLRAEKHPGTLHLIPLTAAFVQGVLLSSAIRSGIYVEKIISDAV